MQGAGRFGIRYISTARFAFGYKWLDFSVPGTACATGKCNDTVWLGTASKGKCLRKNVLGNIAYGALASASPLTGHAETDVRTAYSPELTQLPGVRRADNLAAFGVGSYLTGPETPIDPMRDLAAFTG